MSTLRIGEAARRLGMSPELLRAWETRYGIPVPERTAGGLRLYPEAELERLRAMRDLVGEGMAPAEAARVVGSPEPAVSVDGLEPLAAVLGERLEAFDDTGAQGVLDRLLADFSAEIVVGEVILPTLERMGERWASGDISVAQEHFASTLLRGRMLALGRGWARGVGPRAGLACPSRELHDLGLIAFGPALRTHGWRITYLGQDTPVDTLIQTVKALEPAALVLAATNVTTLTSVVNQLAAMPDSTTLYVGGRGATGPGIKLADEPAAAAREVVRTHAG